MQSIKIQPHYVHVYERNAFGGLFEITSIDGRRFRSKYRPSVQARELDAEALKTFLAECKKFNKDPDSLIAMLDSVIIFTEEGRFPDIQFLKGIEVNASKLLEFTAMRLLP